MTDPIPGTPIARRSRTRAIIATLLFLTVLSVGAWWAGRDLNAPVVQQLSPGKGGHLFDQVASAIAQKYVDSLDAGTIYEKAVNGLLRELNDPHTMYLTDDRLRKLSEQMSGMYAGVGLQFDTRDGWLTVIEPVPGSSAERAGVQVGDRLIEVEGESTKGWTNVEAGKAIRGKPGTKVNIVVDRGGQRIPFTLQRESVHLRAVPRVAMLSGGVGYVDVNVFGQTTVQELQVAIDSLVGMGAKSLVMDLRGNPGGLLEQGVAVAELFLDPGKNIVQLRGRPGAPAQTYSDTTPQRWPNMPLAVLIDRGSASASEIVAGALQDHDRAVVVGVTSFGKGSAQNVFPLVTGGGLRLTTARWYTPVGRSINRPKTPSPDESSNGDDDAPAPTDSVRPQFKTDAGRTVYGGGGITPDVVVMDTVTPAPVLMLARAMGPHFGDYRDALAQMALVLKRRNAVHSPSEPVTPAMLDELYRGLIERRVAPSRAVFDAASQWIARALGYEMTRVVFGPDAEFQRRAQDDRTLLRAAGLLTGVNTPREVFARLESEKRVEVPATR